MGNVARIEEIRNGFKILTGIIYYYIIQERDLWEVLGVDGKTILEGILKKWESIRGIGLIGLRIGIIGGPLWMRHSSFGFHKPCSYMNHVVLLINNGTCWQYRSKEKKDLNKGDFCLWYCESWMSGYNDLL